MNRYLLFQGERYYPQGGASDLSGSFVDLADALSAAKDWLAGDDNLERWVQVYDLAVGSIVHDEMNEFVYNLRCMPDESA